MVKEESLAARVPRVPEVNAAQLDFRVLADRLARRDLQEPVVSVALLVLQARRILSDTGPFLMRMETLTMASRPSGRTVA